MAHPVQPAPPVPREEFTWKYDGLTSGGKQLLQCARIGDQVFDDVFERCTFAGIEQVQNCGKMVDAVVVVKDGVRCERTPGHVKVAEQPPAEPVGQQQEQRPVR